MATTDRNVAVTLTPAEARQLTFLAGELMSDPDEYRNRVGARDYATACRAMAKLHAAIGGEKVAAPAPDLTKRLAMALRPFITVDGVGHSRQARLFLPPARRQRSEAPVLVLRGARAARRIRRYQGSNAMSTDAACPCCGTAERRLPDGGAGVMIIDEPGELGYQCPFCGKGNDLDDPSNSDSLTWSEWASHLWCYTCERDIPTAQCPIRRQSWMSDKWFAEFIARLPFKAIVLASPATTTAKETSP